jgi:hypothetical protein
MRNNFAYTILVGIFENKRPHARSPCKGRLECNVKMGLKRMLEAWNISYSSGPGYRAVAGF